MPSELTIDNLENGVSPLSYVNSDGKKDLDIFFSNNQKDPIKIFKVTKDDVIDCNKYNYYYTKYMGKFGQPYFVTKIDSVFGCKSAVEGTSGDVYRVERKNRPIGEKLKSGFSFFNRPAATAPAGDAASTTGGRKSRNSKNQRKSRKQHKSRKTRR